MIQILGGSEMTSISRRIFSVVKKENLGVGSGAPEEQYYDNYSFYAIVKGAAQRSSGVPNVMT